MLRLGAIVRVTVRLFGVLLLLLSFTVPAIAQQSTPAPGSVLYIVAEGDTAQSIATRFNITVDALLTANNLTDQTDVSPGRTLVIPAANAPAPAQTPEATANVTAPDTTPADPEPTPGFGYGIQAYFLGQDIVPLVEDIEALGVNWVRVEVNWRDFEQNEGEINYDALEAIVTPLEDAGLNILFTVSTSPVWARSNRDESGPPDDFADYANFIGFVADNFEGRVDAYEVWSQPNLRREWNSSVHRISPESYMQLLGGAYTAVKSADPNAAVISAGLAPTGFNDGVNAISDRVYLRGLYANGLAQFSDGIGANPAGFANPPDARCCQPAAGVLTHYQDRAFYFLDTLTDYREIITAAGDADTDIWVTSFGWGTAEGAEEEPGENTVYFTYTDRNEQASYDARAFELGAELGYVGPMFLNNLNACSARPNNVELCYYSLLDANGEPRPAFSTVAALDKSASLSG